MSGIITINRFGVWRPFCANMSDDYPSIAGNVCNLLGSEEYIRYDIVPVVDKAMDVSKEGTQKSVPQTSKELKMEQCSGLYVRCSNVSLDTGIHKVYVDNVTDDMELYTAPWNAVLYSDGIYKCTGSILNPLWIVTSVNCYKGITR